MKFICEHCGSKYTIADEKVRRKILKIRCKNCKNIIEVRDSGMAKAPVAATGAGSSKPAPSVLENKFAASFRKAQSKKTKGTPGLYAAVKQSAQVMEQNTADRIHWFAAIGQAPVGPISARKIHAHRDAGRIEDATLVWKEGMVDWTPLRNCKELVGLLAHIDIELSENKTEETRRSAPKLELFKERQTSHEPLKGKTIGAVDVRVDAPLEEREVPGAPPVRASENPLEGNPGWDIDVDVGAGVGTLHTLMPPKTSGPTQDRVVKLVAIGFFVVALATLGVAVLGGDERVETKTSAGQAVEKVIEKVVFVDSPPREPPLDAVDPGQAEESEENSSTNLQNRRVARPKTKPKVANDKKAPQDDRTKELMERMGMSAPTSAARLASRAPKQGSVGGRAKNTLSSNQVKTVVNRNKRGVQSCYERALKQGEAPDNEDLRVDFKLTVGSSGMVKRVLIQGAGSRYPNLTSCLKRNVTKWVFPSSSGDSPVEFPFVFTPR